jgi:hypothetical protein
VPRILGMEPRVALLVGGAVAVVAFLAWRARSASPAAPEAPPELPGAGDALGAVGASAQDTFAQQMQALELSSAQREQQFAAGQMERQASLETETSNLQLGLLRFAQGKGRLPRGVQCPSGKIRFDPSTGQFICRERQHRGFFSGVNLGDLLGRVNFPGFTIGGGRSQVTIGTPRQSSTPAYTDPFAGIYQSREGL